MEPTTCQEWIWNKTIISRQPQPSIFHSQVLQTEKPSTEVTGTSNRIMCHIPSLLRAEWDHALSLSFKLHVLKHKHLPVLRFSPLFSATSLSPGKCHWLLLWLEDHWWQLVDIKLSLCPWWLWAIQDWIGHSQWLSLYLTSPLINANFSVDYRAIILLTNYLLVMGPGVVLALHLLWPLHLLWMKRVVVEENCGLSLVRSFIISVGWTKAAITGITQIIQESTFILWAVSNTAKSQSRIYSIMVVLLNIHYSRNDLRIFFFKPKVLESLSISCEH